MDHDRRDVVVFVEGSDLVFDFLDGSTGGEPMQVVFDAHRRTGLPLIVGVNVSTLVLPSEDRIQPNPSLAFRHSPCHRPTDLKSQILPVNRYRGRAGCGVGGGFHSKRIPACGHRLPT